MKRLPLVAVLLLAGCGGTQPPKPVQPHLPRSLAQPWRAQADDVASALAAGDGCLALQRATTLQNAVIAAVQAHRVAPRFQEELMSGVNDLVARIRCVPPAPPHHEKHGKGHGKK
jgi:hypothetical protein